MNYIQKAKDAFYENKNISIDERLKWIKSIKNWILKNENKIVKSIQEETKKSYSDAYISEIFGVLEHLDVLLHKGKKYLADEKIPTPIVLMGKKSKLYKDPLGVILIISPWNYPFYQAIVPITSALITGNSVVYKPSELTPLKSLLNEIFSVNDLINRGLVQIVHGDGSIGKELIDQKPNKIFFTGSVSTGRKIMEQASKNLIPVELELGGKDAMVVFNNSKIDRAIKGATWGTLTNCGQSCTSTERIFVEEDSYAYFKEQLLLNFKKINQDVDSDGNADIGLITSDTQVSIIADHLKDALEKGAVQLTGHDWDFKSKKIPPILLDKVTPEMKVFNEETFGPIAWVYPFKSTEEAIRLVNDSPYGLTASVWNKDIKFAQDFAHQLEVGGVSINNVMLTEGNHELPFGGVKDSGIGRYKGQLGLYSFCNLKSIIIDGNHGKTDPNWYPYTQEKLSLFKNLTQSFFSGGLTNFIKFAINGLKLEKLSNTLGKKGRS